MVRPQATTNQVNSGQFKAKHGMRYSREYATWSSMLARCANPLDADHGARGIKVCERWRESFEAFYEDMGPRPTCKSIERLDNDGDYEPGNCKWATPKEQARNRRTSRFLAHNGRRLTLAAWAEATGIPRNTIANRLLRGWSMERALTRPRASSRRELRQPPRDARAQQR